MNQILSYVLNFFLCILEIAMLNIFLGSMFSKQIREKKLFVYFIGAACLHFAINLPGSPALNFVLVPVLLFAYTILVFQITVSKAFIYTAIYYFVFVCGREIAFEMLYHLFGEMFLWMEELLSAANGMFFYMAEYMLSLLFLLYLRKYMKEVDIRGDSRWDWCLLVVPMSFVVILFSFYYMDFPNERYLQILLCCGAFLLYFFNMVIFVFLTHFTQVMNQIKIAELSLLKKDMEQENFENIAKMNEVYRKYMHDVHQYFYQFKSLASSGESEAIVAIISAWENNLKGEESDRLYTGSSVVNVLLSRCLDKAKERQIEMNITVEDALNLEFIQDVDKISMFGNLLDNAVEAAERCEEGNRKININMFMGNKHFLVFQIRNTWVKKTGADRGKLLSTKKDAKNHGLGIGIVRDLAQKYGGSLEFEEEDAWFVATLMIAQ